MADFCAALWLAFPPPLTLLSNYLEPGPDAPSADWLGRHSGRERVRRSGLWNNNHVDERHDPEFLNVLEEFARRIPA